MKAEYKQKLETASKNKNLTKNKLVGLKKRRKGAVDQLFHRLHDEVFEEINCLECANCCKTTGPLLTQKDIDRIAKHLKISGSGFIQQYLKIDEDNDYIFTSMPCPFLGTDNYCDIYDVRPKACREYPHTDRTNQIGILKLVEKNTLICPAVAEIIERIPK
ncbi:MAG: YkgJ family cysteine cluster protein [Bacteroidota bacterium]